MIELRLAKKEEINSAMEIINSAKKSFERTRDKSVANWKS